jgi:hypothetical protein
MIDLPIEIGTVRANKGCCADPSRLKSHQIIGSSANISVVYDRNLQALAFCEILRALLRLSSGINNRTILHAMIKKVRWPLTLSENVHPKGLVSGAWNTESPSVRKNPRVKLSERLSIILHMEVVWNFEMKEVSKVNRLPVSFHSDVYLDAKEPGPGYWAIVSWSSVICRYACPTLGWLPCPCVQVECFVVVS